MNIMQMRNVIIFSGLLFFISCSNIQAPEFKMITGFSASEEGDTIILRGNGIFYNPNNTKLTLKDADISVYLNEQMITRIKEKFNLEISPGKEFSVPLTVKMDQDQVRELITNNALSLLAGRGMSLMYKGKIRIRTLSLSVRVPIDEEISINLNDLL